MNIQILNKKDGPLSLRSHQAVLYIGRIRGRAFHYGNPFSHLRSSTAAVQVKDRDEAVDAFDKWLDGSAYREVEPQRRTWILSQIQWLAHEDTDLILVCHCHPLRCHGDILKRRILEARQEP